MGSENASPTDLDSIDRRILDLLLADGRMTIKELASEVGLSPSPCLRRVRRLEEERVIRGYRAEIDPVVLGHGLVSFIGVVLDRHDSTSHTTFEDSVLAEPAILSAHRTTGDTDYLLRVATRDLAELDHLLWQVLPTFPGVGRFETLVSTSCVKGEWVA